MIQLPRDFMSCDYLIKRWEHTPLLRSVRSLLLSTDVAILEMVRHLVSSVVPPGPAGVRPLQMGESGSEAVHVCSW